MNCLSSGIPIVCTVASYTDPVMNTTEDDTMKTYRTLLLASAVALAVLSPLTQARGPDPERQLERLNEILLLSPEQSTKVEGILKDTHSQRQQLLEEQRPQREAMRQQMQGLHENTRTQLVEVLTPEQMARFDAMHEERMNRMNSWKDGGMGGPKGPGRGMGDCGAFWIDEQ